jgi:hypothetical protein
MRGAASTKNLAPSRVGKVQLSGYFHPDFKRGVRLVQAETGESYEALLARALNGLFREHNVPIVDQATGAEKLTTIKEITTGRQQK